MCPILCLAGAARGHRGWELGMFCGLGLCTGTERVLKKFVAWPCSYYCKKKIISHRMDIPLVSHLCKLRFDGPQARMMVFKHCAWELILGEGAQSWGWPVWYFDKPTNYCWKKPFATCSAHGGGRWRAEPSVPPERVMWGSSNITHLEIPLSRAFLLDLSSTFAIKVFLMSGMELVSEMLGPLIDVEIF